MFDKHTTALYAIIISSIVIASVFAIGFYHNKNQHRVTRLPEAAVMVTRLAAIPLAAAQHQAVAQLVVGSGSGY